MVWYDDWDSMRLYAMWMRFQSYGMRFQWYCYGVCCKRYDVQPSKFKVLVGDDTIKNISIINITVIWIHECKFNALH